MQETLPGVQAKLDRADELIAQLVDEMDQWIQTCGSALEHLRANDHRSYLLIFRIGTPPPTYRWSCVIGDILHNLRSALDHLVYAMASTRTGGGVPPGARQLAFPITDNPDEFARKVANGLLRGLSDDAVAIAERHQPYDPVSGPRCAPLRTLADYSNSDKHRLLNLAVIRPHGTTASFNPSNDPLLASTSVKVTYKSGPLSDGCELLRFEFELADPDFTVTALPILEVAMEVKPGALGQRWERVYIVLDSIRIAVREVVDELAPLM